MSHPPTGIWSRRFEWDPSALGAWLVRNAVPIWVGLGAIFRIGQFLHGRTLWLDEASLVANVNHLTPRQFFGPLISSQLAPPGFLILEWVGFRAVSNPEYGARLVPLIASLLALGLFLLVTRRILPARAVPLGVALFATADDLIYFAAEAKQYSSDVTAALAATLIGLTLGTGPLSARRVVLLAGAGALLVWFSHPVAFVLAAVGVTGLANRVWAGDGWSAGGWVAVGSVWVASLAAVHVVAMRQLDHQGMMWSFWASAFPPAPSSLWNASWLVRRSVYFFANPLHFFVPLGFLGSALPPAMLCLLGAISNVRDRRDQLALLILPAGFVLLAAALRLYPFHGRLVLFLIPAALLGIARGLDWVRDLRLAGRWIWTGLVVLLVGLPLVLDLARLVEPRQRLDHNDYGDRRPAALDPTTFPF